MSFGAVTPTNKPTLSDLTVCSACVCRLLIVTTIGSFWLFRETPNGFRRWYGWRLTDTALPAWNSLDVLFPACSVSEEMSYFSPSHL